MSDDLPTVPIRTTALVETLETLLSALQFTTTSQTFQPVGYRASRWIVERELGRYDRLASESICRSVWQSTIIFLDLMS